LYSLFPLSFQVFHSPIDGGDEFMVSLAFGPSLFRSQHIGELGQHVAFFLHYFLSVSLTTPHRSSSAVATSRGGHRSLRSGREESLAPTAIKGSVASLRLDDVERK